MADSTRATFASARSLRSAGARSELVTFEHLEPRMMLSAAFDLTELTRLRSDPAYAGIDGSGIGVAVLDSGVYSQHPALASNFVAWYDATSERATTARDGTGHGTHVSGTIGASDSRIGVATSARLIGVRVLGDAGSAEAGYDSLTEGLRWVLENRVEYNIRVVNMSLGTRTNSNNPSIFSAHSQTYYIRELERAGVTVVTASGNSYADFIATGAAFPAVVSTISVGSVWEDSGVGDTFPLAAGSSVDFTASPDTLSSFSQRSTLPNQLFAPGQTIYSTWNGAGGNYYNTIPGTSMAAPFVSGLVALMQDAAYTFGARYLAPAEVLGILRDTANFIVDANNDSNYRIVHSAFGSASLVPLPETGLVFRRVNAFHAVARVRDVVRGGVGAASNTDLNRSTATATDLGVLRGGRSVGAVGAIDKDGSNTPGARDIDFYRIEVVGGGDLTVALTAIPGGRPGSDPIVKVFSSSGQQLAFKDDSGDSLFPSVTLVNQSGGVYYVAVAGYENESFDASGSGASAGTVGDYQLSVSLVTPDPDGTLATAELISLPTLGTDFERVIGLDGTKAVGAGDVDVYAFTPVDDGEVRFTLQADQYGSNGASAAMRILSANGSTLAGYMRPAFSRDFNLTYPVTRGTTYFLVVSGASTSIPNITTPFSRTGSPLEVGYYRLWAFLDNRDQNGSVVKLLVDGAAATPIQGSLAGAIGYDFGSLVGRDGRFDVDVFRFAPATSGLLEVAVSGHAGFVPTIRVWKYIPALEDIVVWAELPAGETKLVIPSAIGDEYFVAVSAADNVGYEWYSVASGTGGSTGTYTLTPRMLALSHSTALWDDSLSSPSVRTISAGVPVTGVIGMDGGLVSSSADIDLFRFVPESTGRFVVQTASSGIEGFDTVLRVFDSQGRQIAWNDDADASTTQSRLSVTLTAGVTYFIGVTSWSPTPRAYNPALGTGGSGLTRGRYSLIVTADGPHIRLTGKGVAIAQGDTTPTTADWTNFGGIPIDGFVKTRVFKIVNDGTQPLQLIGASGSRIRLIGSHAANFKIIDQPPSQLAPGAVFKFRVRYDATAPGFQHATIVIATGAPGGSSIQFAIRGTGLKQPLLALAGGETARLIANGDTTPSVLDWTEFGQVSANGSRSRTFTISNNGSNRLLISGIEIQGTSMFSVVSAPTVITPGQTGALTIRFLASVAGRSVATVRILSNDPLRPVYSFMIGATT